MATARSVRRRAGSCRRRFVRRLPSGQAERSEAVAGPFSGSRTTAATRNPGLDLRRGDHIEPVDAGEPVHGVVCGSVVLGRYRQDDDCPDHVRRKTSHDNQALRDYVSSRTSAVASIDERRAGNSQRHSPTTGPC